MSVLLDESRTNDMFQVGANVSQTVSVDFGELPRENPPTMPIFAQGGFTAANTAASSPARATIIITHGGVPKAGDVITMDLVSGKVGTVSFKLGNSVTR